MFCLTTRRRQAAIPGYLFLFQFPKQRCIVTLARSPISRLRPAARKGAYLVDKAPQWNRRRVFDANLYRGLAQIPGLSLRKLAPLVGLSASRISQIEQGNEPYNQRFLEPCAKALHCRVVDLLSRPPPGAEPRTPPDANTLLEASHVALMHQLRGEIEACQKGSEALNRQLLFLGALATQLIGHSEEWEDAIRSFVERAGRLYPATN